MDSLRLEVSVLITIIVILLVCSTRWHRTLHPDAADIHTEDDNACHMGHLVHDEAADSSSVCATPQLIHTDVRVHMACPGFVNTTMIRRAQKEAVRCSHASDVLHLGVSFT
jgi:hypothetical protein